MSEAAWHTIAEVMLRMQLHLDRDWSLEEAARTAGYEPHHFARTFGDIVGHPPARYVRLLRLERAAAELSSGNMSVLQVAMAAGYQSGEAFARAFRRACGHSPRAFRRLSAERRAPWGNRPNIRYQVPDDELPAGLAPSPRIGELGPLWGWTVRVKSFEPPDMMPATALLLEQAPPDGPWQLGGLAQPWGWIADGPSQERDLRLVRYLDAPRVGSEPPILPWRLSPSWYVTFGYRGPLQPIADVFDWIQRRWIPGSGLRSGFLPTLSRVEHFMPGDVHAELCVPLHRLDTALTG